MILQQLSHKRSHKRPKTNTNIHFGPDSQILQDKVKQQRQSALRPRACTPKAARQTRVTKAFHGW